ncbi:hypothetical protein [Mucilaginibacter antarcticus]|uniref:hypothetical protein n=1 Tax=Mucilaginibacter antarcticus TaxID=1855725 RepID=UPI00362B9C3E
MSALALRYPKTPQVKAATCLSTQAQALSLKNYQAGGQWFTRYQVRVRKPTAQYFTDWASQEHQLAITMTPILIPAAVCFIKETGVWNTVFSMQTGPQGPRGLAGTNGTNGTDGFSVLNGTVNPSNTATGLNGDFYINTGNYTFLAQKPQGFGAMAYH